MSFFKERNLFLDMGVWPTYQNVWILTLSSTLNSQFVREVISCRSSKTMAVYGIVRKGLKTIAGWPKPYVWNLVGGNVRQQYTTIKFMREKDFVLFEILATSVYIFSSFIKLRTSSHPLRESHHTTSFWHLRALGSLFCTIYELFISIVACW